jgi:hypothetical protein
MPLAGYRRDTMKKRLLAYAGAAAMAALVGIYSTGVAAQPLPTTWSVVVHFEYANGTSFDYVLARGLEASEASSILADCGRSHRTGSVVRYYCYPVPE